MAGLLDIFAPDDPAQKQGLLAATMALLQSGAPSRRPISTMEGIIGAQQAYGQSMDDYKKQDLARQMAQQGLTMNGLKIKDAESDLKNQELVREREAKIRAELMGQGARGAAMPEQTPTVPSAPMGGSIMAGMAPQMPSWMPQQPAAQSAPAAPSQPQDLQAATAQRLLKEAEVRARYGDNDGANKLYEAATKLQPKYANDFRVARGADGKLHNYFVADNGTLKDAGVGVKPEITEMDGGGYKLYVDKNEIAPGTRYDKTQSPDTIASNKLGWARLNFDKSKESDSGLGPLTPSAIDNAAARYNFDGTLPPMGMGKDAAAGRSRILNRAAELKAGVDPNDQRREQLVNRGDVATQTAAVRSFATGRDGQAVQSANTALNHLQTIRELAEAQKSGDVRAFNAAARQLGAAFGSAAPTNLNAALIMVAPEVSKAVVGAGGTGHERDQAMQALNPNGSPDQIIGATQTMQELFGGRLTEARRTYERTTKKQDFDAMLSPAAQQVLSRAQQHGAPAASSYSVTAPNGKTYTFPDAKALANFKLSAGIK